MKITIATGIYPPDVGGPATYSKIIAKGFLKQGNEVTVVTYGSRGDSEEKQVCYISRSIPKGIRHIIYFFRVLLESRTSDVIFAQDPVSAGVPAYYAARMLRKPFVVKIVGDYAWEQGVQRWGIRDLLDDFLTKKYGFRAEFLRAIERFVAQRALRIIVPSKYLASVVEHWGVEKKNIVVISNTVSHVQSISRDQARSKHGLSGTIILSAGRLVPWKGFELLISLMKEFTSQQVTLVIVGDGPDREHLQAEREHLQLHTQVIFTGAIPQEVLWEYLTASDIFALNTGYEGYSHQILEAMLAGCAVISTPVGGNREILEHEVNALVVPYNDREYWQDAIKKLVENSALRQELSSRAQHDAQSAQKDDMVIKTLQNLSNL